MTSDPRMTGFRTRAEVADVLALLERRTGPLGAEEIAATLAAGRVLAADVVSTLDVPLFDRSAMDGYAVRAEETFGASEYAPARLRVTGAAYPGRAFAGAVGPGEAVRIMTGAPLPGGADAVLVAEEARPAGDGLVDALAAVPPGKNVSRRGEDVPAGTTVLAAGRALRPQDVGLLSLAGIAAVSVRRRPAVDIVITGNELLPAGSRPEGHRIVDANSPMLRALTARDGGEARAGGIVRDDPEALRERLLSCAGDAVLVTGGTSVGEEDHVPPIVRALGELPVHGIAMRPSSPTGVGFLPPRAPGGGDRPIFLLPGNPVSCLCAYDFFAGPTIRALGGRPRAWPYRTEATPLGRKIASQSGRVDYVRVRIEDGKVVPLAVSGGSVLSTTTRADGFVIVPRDAEGYAEGTTVEVHLYG